ncbi:glutathione S-transferase family protein [Variovorax sp. RHLX14]|uniref:glutathione S-transferase family protein n=1 Tax=Variovorax sp. RHLX14 TaxID=1259731 RepID=UPI003F460904
MSDLILHHYAFSTFSEKARLALGLKGLAYRSVDIAGMPPRPLLEPLTGGYRRVPVLQIGADIYCDTNIILPTLERLFPSPAHASLYPDGTEGVARGLGFAWERALWIPSIAVLTHFIGEHIPAEFLKDRKESYLMVDISKEAMAPELPLYRQRVVAHYAWLKAALADGRRFILGERPGALDLACYQTIFLLRKNCPADVDAMLGIDGPLPGWYDRIAALGHGTPESMSAEDAFASARDASPATPTHLQPDGDIGGLRAGDAVVVRPDDNARVPVAGTLVAASADEIVIHRRDPDAGDLHLHFPRLGFDVLPA